MEKVSYILKSKFLLTKEELKQLDELHYSDGFCFRQLKNKFKLGIVILVKEIKTDKILSWGLVFERNDCEITLFIYTHKKYRRLGLGTKVYNICLENFGKPNTSSHDRKSKAFFDSVDS